MLATLNESKTPKSDKYLPISWEELAGEVTKPRAVIFEKSRRKRRHAGNTQI